MHTQIQHTLHTNWDKLWANKETLGGNYTNKPPTASISGASAWWMYPDSKQLAKLPPPLLLLEPFFLEQCSQGIALVPQGTKLACSARHAEAKQQQTKYITKDRHSHYKTILTCKGHHFQPQPMQILITHATTCWSPMPTNST